MEWARFYWPGQNSRNLQENEIVRNRVGEFVATYSWNHMQDILERRTKAGFASSVLPASKVRRLSP